METQQRGSALRTHLGLELLRHDGQRDVNCRAGAAGGLERALPVVRLGVPDGLGLVCVAEVDRVRRDLELDRRFLRSLRVARHGTVIATKAVGTRGRGTA